jgi:hypothetical protein
MHLHGRAMLGWEDLQWDVSIDWICLDQLSTGGNLLFTRLWILGLRRILQMSSKGE